MAEEREVLVRCEHKRTIQISNRQDKNHRYDYAQHYRGMKEQKEENNAEEDEVKTIIMKKRRTMRNRKKRR